MALHSAHELALAEDRSLDGSADHFGKLHVLQQKEERWVIDHPVSERLVEPSWKSIGRPAEKSIARQAWESRRDPRLLKVKAKKNQKKPKFNGMSPSSSAATIGSFGLPQVAPPPNLPTNFLSVYSVAS